MSRQTNSFSDSFWSSFQKGIQNNLYSRGKRKENDPSLNEYQSSVDETEAFHDPYSELNLFLSARIKNEIAHCGSCKKWSLKIQEELIEKITPEFQKRFPHYRLGISALKKTWEKVIYYSQQIEEDKMALSASGHLNIDYLIQQNLKQYNQYKHPMTLSPYHYAHQLASRLSDYIATIDAKRPKMDELTQSIWSMQRHLITGYGKHKYKGPYDDCDMIDRIIIKTILDLVSKEPLLCNLTLEHKVKATLQALHSLPSFSSLEDLSGAISALLADKLYKHSSFEKQYSGEEQNAITRFIQRHTSLHSKTSAPMEKSEIVRRILALYSLACQLPKDLRADQLKQAIEDCYPMMKRDHIHLPQAVFAFISAELVLLKNEEYCHSIEYVRTAIISAYEETKRLPKMIGKETDILEIISWRSLSETSSFLDKLPYRLGQKIDEEISSIIIEHPKKGFSSLVREVLSFFQKTKELTESKKWKDIDQKIHRWCLQGDLLCSSIHYDKENPLIKLIIEKNKELSLDFSPHDLVISVCEEYFKRYPELLPYSACLSSKIVSLYKVLWYTEFSSSTESSLDRFVKWHAQFLSIGPTTMHSEEEIINKVKSICEKSIPLLPIDLGYLRQLFPSKFHLQLKD